MKIKIVALTTIYLVSTIVITCQEGCKDNYFFERKMIHMKRPLPVYFSIIYRHGRVMHDKAMKQFGITGQQMGYIRWIGGKSRDISGGSGQADADR